MFENGCPVCKFQCCCRLKERQSSSSVSSSLIPSSAYAACANLYHCYRKCSSGTSSTASSSAVSGVGTEGTKSSSPFKRKLVRLSSEEQEQSSETSEGDPVSLPSSYELFMRAINECGGGGGSSNGYDSVEFKTSSYHGTSTL